MKSTWSASVSALFAFLLTVAPAFPVAAQMSVAAPLSSPWLNGENSRLRLIAGDTSGDTWTAALQVELDQGWKTYWRNPGDSGVPPRFDFSASANVGRAEARYPVPHRFSDAYGDSIGYEGKVAFPIEIDPDDRSKPVRLELKLDYAVCEKICVPATASLTIQLVPGRQDLAGEVTSALKALPKPDNGERLSVVRNADDSLTLLFEAPDGAGSVDLFAEPPAGWYLALPQPAGRDEEGRHRFTLSLEGRREGAQIAGERFTFTGVSDKGAFERTLTLD